MMKYFDISIEFNHQKLEDIITSVSMNGKGYCCFIDNVLLSTAHKDRSGRLKTILNSAVINSCDGSYIALIASKIYKQQFKAYNGPELFNKFIYYKDKHCIIGSSTYVFNKLIQKLEQSGYDSTYIYHVPLPFAKVHDFDYRTIADKINGIGARYNWVSLGAPKQEEFMFRIINRIDRGVMLGVGAAINYFAGEIKNIPKWAINMHLIWLYRIFTEPTKQIPRCIDIAFNTPKIFINEWEKNKIDKK